MEDKLLYDNFEKILRDGLVKLCTSASLMDGMLLSSPDIDEKWEEFIADYVADAVKEFNDYPEAAIAWPAFVGMAAAHKWDDNFDAFKALKYKDLYGPNGWDDMDEGILHYVLGLDLASEEALKIANTLKSCALATLALIRHEGIEPQTRDGFFILTRSYSVMYAIGAGIELRRLKYTLSKLDLPVPGKKLPRS